MFSPLELWVSKVVAICASALALGGVVAVLWLSHEAKGLRTDRDAWKVAAQTWRKAALDWERAFKRSEDLREREDAQALKAIEEAGAICTKRVAQARRASLSLASLLNKEPERDEAHCPRRSLLDPDELRDAFDAPAG